MIYVIKKDGTREEFDPQKIVKAVNKSAARILYTFSDGIYLAVRAGTCRLAGEE